MLSGYNSQNQHTKGLQSAALSCYLQLLSSFASKKQCRFIETCNFTPFQVPSTRIRFHNYRFQSFSYGCRADRSFLLKTILLHFQIFPLWRPVSKVTVFNVKDIRFYHFRVDAR